MRIISGRARGTKLYTLEGENTRPTLDRVKESFFNIIQSDLQDKIFLDLFSGSGAIGLEAVSRGARKSILCDNSKKACEIINKNMDKTHLKEFVELYNEPYDKVISNKIKEKVDIVYIDPPYKTDLAYKSIDLMIKKDLLNDESLIIIETDQETEILKKINELNIKIVDKRKYGRAHLIFLKKEMR